MHELNPENCLLVFEGEQCYRPLHNHTLGYCNAHYLQFRRGEKLRPTRRSGAVYRSQPCSFKGCPNKAVGKKLCHAHRYQLKHKGVMTPLHETQSPRYQHAKRRPDGTKRCFICCEWLSEECFSSSKDSVDGLKTRCKTCVSTKVAKTRDENHERKIIKAYNVPQGWYGEQLKRQGGCCAICGVSAESLTKRLAVDHNHNCCPETGKSCGKCVRALLCHKCNFAVGFVENNPGFEKRVNEYLDNHQLEDIGI